MAGLYGPVGSVSNRQAKMAEGPVLVPASVYPLIKAGASTSEQSGAQLQEQGQGQGRAGAAAPKGAAKHCGCERLGLQQQVQRQAWPQQQLCRKEAATEEQEAPEAPTALKPSPCCVLRAWCVDSGACVGEGACACVGAGACGGGERRGHSHESGGRDPAGGAVHAGRALQSLRLDMSVHGEGPAAPTLFIEISRAPLVAGVCVATCTTPTGRSSVERTPVWHVASASWERLLFACGHSLAAWTIQMLDVDSSIMDSDPPAPAC